MMNADILTILSNAGSAGIVGLMFLAYLYYSNKPKKDGVDRIDANQQTDIEVLKHLNKIETNDLFHLKEDMSYVKDKMARLETKIDILLNR